MGSIKKKTVTRPLPPNATVTPRRTRSGIELVASWKDRTGKKRTAVVVTAADGSQRVKTKSETYYAKFRDGDGIVREVPTGCRDKQAAMTKLAELERIAEKIRGGVITSNDCQIADGLKTPLDQHLADYKQALTVCGRSTRYIDDTQRKIKAITDGCNIVNLRGLTADKVENWLAERQKAGVSPSTRNTYFQAVKGFLNWCIQAKRLQYDPLRRIKRADDATDKRRTRRALTEPELNRLLFVARWRPLADYGRETVSKVGKDRPDNTKSRKTWTMKPLAMAELPEAVEQAKTKLANNPHYINELNRRGWERSLIYKVAVLTGLRRGEIESLTVEHVHLDEHQPFIRMRSQDTKNRQAVDVPLRVELADDLRLWIESKREPLDGVLSLEIKRKGLLSSTPVFDVPRQLVKTLDRDLIAADIPKADDRGRTVDFHSLRHTFGTLLSVGGVSPRTAQQAMRHSDIKLTMNTYTDPRLLDVAGAVDALPMLR